MQLVLNPKRFDVLVMENMFGDILSDEGRFWPVPSACCLLPSIGERKPNGAWVGLYEPVHGSAPDKSPARTKPTLWEQSFCPPPCSNTASASYPRLRP